MPLEPDTRNCTQLLRDNCFGMRMEGSGGNAGTHLRFVLKLSTRSALRMLAAAALLTTSALAINTGMQGLVATSAHAQEIGSEIFGDREVNPDAQMLLEADELIYNNDAETVTAQGNVQIAYDGYTLVAKQVSYDRRSGRVVATGSVEILEPGGNRIFAEEIDITDDFQDGFVSALNVETADNTSIAAESAERRDGEVTEFTNGVYTACEACEDDPDKPPLWQIRANKVIIDNRTKTVSYEGASFELFGKPIAYLAYFSHADPAIKRKSGFLIPTFDFTDELGYSGTARYFLNLAPNYDLTFAGTYYSEQGFLGDVEWRHRLENGQYNLRIAGIDQQDRSNFSGGTVDNAETDRYAIMSQGAFEINSRWDFGWSWLYQTDENFARTYELENYSARDITNSVYLTGLGDKNYFDLRAQQFLVQDNRVDFDATLPGNQSIEDQQGAVLPSLDYNAVSDEDVAGGQFRFDLNITNVQRDDGQIVQNTGFDARNHGVEGEYVRASAFAEWKRAEVVGNGALVTLSASAQVDAINFDIENPNSANLFNPAAINSNQNPLTSSDSLVRTMPTGMLEIRYPMVANDGVATHIFEPIAQLLVRPDETDIGAFPNEDAQSLVFDTSNLFRANKFSGYDRVEGGTRANVGFRYSASFQNGDSINVVAGQSFHLAGDNSFAQRDLVNAGLESGLETDRSDYVASIDYQNTDGLTLGASGRFDEENLELRRAEIGARIIRPDYSLNTSYVFTDAQPNYALDEDRHEIRGSGSLRLDENWRAFGSIAYDIERETLTSESIGLAYDDECFSLSLSYENERSRFTGSETGRKLSFRIGLRTIGNYGYSHDLLDDQQ